MGFPFCTKWERGGGGGGGNRRSFGQRKKKKRIRDTKIETPYAAQSGNEKTKEKRKEIIGVHAAKGGEKGKKPKEKRRYCH